MLPRNTVSPCLPDLRHAAGTASGSRVSIGVGDDAPAGLLAAQDEI